MRLFLFYIVLAAGSSAHAQQFPRPQYTRGFVAHPVSRPHQEKTVIVPYPVFLVPSNFGGFGPSGPPPAENTQSAGYAPPPPPPPPPVTLSRNFEPEAVAPPEPPRDDRAAVHDDEPTIYLIALKDHTIFPAVAYWVEGDTLHYITAQGGHNRATLALVDGDFSKQLNNERRLEFKLPATK